ncbi:uncharacterized protein LOC142986306 [Anticarsia gemmatalis]|uniref:uncharacterized protein LOC142986306 n=1 Tax=Anticarsia gemmatalis TaxID=129554 RepID=UPI003F765066
MWWQVVFQVSCLLLTEGMHVVHDPLLGATPGISCIQYDAPKEARFGRIFREGWRPHAAVGKKVITKRSSPDIPYQFTLNLQPNSRRMDTLSIIDNLIPRGDYLVKEHAKLVHDINSLRQVVFVEPFTEKNKDYDDSIFHEIIETSATSTAGPPSSKPFATSTRAHSTSTKGSSIPIILLGGASQRQVVKSQPINFAKPTVSLVGTTISPFVKHPYPFVMHRKPVKICMTSLPPIPATHAPSSKSFWERLIDYFIPKRSLGR